MDDPPFGPILRQSVQRLRDAMAGCGALELELSVGTTSVRIVRDAGGAEAPLEPLAEEAPRELTIAAPTIGVFHFPGGQPPHPGDQMRVGDVIGTIEVLSVAHDVMAEDAGAVVEVLVHDGEPVEYGQALLRLEPLADEA